MPSLPKIEKMVWPSECARLLNCRVNLISAVKKYLGIERKKVFPSEIERFLKENPAFMESTVYHRKAA